MSQVKCCCFDLEASSLNADFGVLLCAVVKAPGKRPVVFRGDVLNPDWQAKRSDDRVLVANLVEHLNTFDIWVVYNGLKFDLPFLRTRLARWGLPPLPARKLLDPYQLVRNKLKLSYSSLQSVAALARVGRKEGLDGNVWLRASLDGDTKAMDRIVAHCVNDVRLLEKVCGIVKPYSSAFNSWGSAA
jgi:uncharacterized protein YprB with RNaseH-like and TPR domain